MAKVSQTTKLSISLRGLGACLPPRISFMKFVKLIRKHPSPLVHVVYLADVVLRAEGLNNGLVSVATKALDNHLSKEDKSDRLINETDTTLISRLCAECLCQFVWRLRYRHNMHISLA